MAFPTGWGRKCAVVIANAQVSGTSHTDFPVLVTMAMLPSEMFDADGTYPALSGGGDVRFSSDSAGATQLACEVVSFVTDNNPANGSAEIWVKVPTLSGSVDTTIYVWYAKAAESQPAVTNTYGRNAVWSGYLAVWHLADASGTDSTGIDDLAPMPAATQAGPYGADATTFSGTSAITTGFGIADALSGSSNATISAWAEIDAASIGSVDDNIAETSSSQVKLWGDVVSGNSRWGVVFFGTGAGGTRIEYSANIAADTWYFVTGTWDGETEALYVDDDPPITHTLSASVFITVNNVFFRVGANFNGGIKHVNVRNSTASSDWISTEYNNQNSPATFASAGTPESVGGVTLPTLSAATAINITSSGFQPRVTATY